MQQALKWTAPLWIVLSFFPLLLKAQTTISPSELSKHPIKRIQANGIDYCYVEKGQGETIFLLHGFPDLAGTWDAVIDDLSKDYHCVAPFLRGYFPTGIAPDGDYAPKTIAQDIGDMAESMGIDRYYVVGQDWGASITYAIANLYPDRVKKIVTIAIPHPSFIKASFGTLYKARHFLKFANEKKSPSKTRKKDYRYLDKLYERWSPNWSTYPETAQLIKRSFDQPGYLEAALGYYWTFNRNRGDEELSKFYNQLPTMPVLTLAGEQDGALSMKHFYRMEEAMTTPFRLASHPEAGHFLQREDPAFVIKEVRAFLK